MKHETGPNGSYGRSDDRTYGDVARFVDTHDTAKKLEIIEGLEDIGLESALYFAGAMNLEIAASNPILDEEQRIGFLANAKANWERVISLRKVVSGEVDKNSQLAAVGLACLPLHASIAVNGRNPNLSTIRRSYDQLLDIGQRSVNSTLLTHGKNDEHSILRNQDLRGGISEITVLLLLQRFALKHTYDNEWVAVPSLLSQDRATRNKGSAESGAWDTSVFSQRDAISPPQLTYKIQVKTRVVPNGLLYDDDISQVAVRNDLSLGSREMAFDAVIRECDVEQLGDCSASDTLDKRTELILDILDNQ